MKEFHREDVANRTGLAQAWTVKSADRLFTRHASDGGAGRSCHVQMQGFLENFSHGMGGLFHFVYSEWCHVFPFPCLLSFHNISIC